MTHKKRITKLIAGVLSVVMVFGVLMFVSPTEAQAISLNATDTGFYNLAYGANGATTFGAGAQIRVENKLRTSKNIATYTLTDEGWTTTDAFVWNSTSLNRFEAWYPVTDGTSFDTFTIPTDQSSEQLLGAADWMTIGTKEMETPSDKTLKLHFMHMLTKVTVNITSWSSEYDGTDKTVEDVKIYSLATDIVQDREGCIGQIKTASLTPIAPLADGNSYTAIVCPGLYSSDQEFMTFTVNGTDNLTVLAKVPSPIEIEAAKHYTFNLTVGKDGVAIQSVNVAGWANGGTIDGGVAKEVVRLNVVDATAMNADQLNTAVTKALEAGETDIEVTLNPDAPAEMITAIRRAICDTEGVADGSIHLILGGVTTIPGTTNWDGIAFGPGDIYDEAGEIVDQELVTQLASINLPDVTEIGAQAFYFCENLVSVSAPKAQTIGAQALGYTALTSVEFPELTTIPTDMFSGSWTLSSAKFPKVTTIEQGGLLVGAKFAPENNPTPFPLELTAEGDITFNGSNHFNIASQNYSGNVNKKIRESSVAPSAFSKIEDKGIAGKVASSVGGKLIETPLHKTTRSAVGLVYDRRKHKPYVGSALYTIFKWGLLFILAACPPLLILFVVTGALGKIKKIF